MNYSVVAALTVVSVILLVVSPVFGGGIRGGAINNGIKTNDSIDVSSIEEEARRILNEDSKEEEEEEEEDTIKEQKEEYVPIVTADCADTEGLIEVTESGDKLNCREIRKTKICDRKHNGSCLYDSCQKSCGICLEVIPTTDAPTADLIELVVTDSPTAVAYKSIAPSYQPTTIITELPTPSPSQYPTPVPTTMIAEIYIEEETEEPTYEKILDPEFIDTTTTTIDDPIKYEESKAPSYQPTIKFTDDPTETPSHYPTDSPTENHVAEVMQGLDDDILLSVLGDLH